ncbi:flagellar hook-length control protein FliK [Undibacterium rugosum]|uniref:flagellar hook-length control protein FliK n=1 Tax=Undibacterium rugosum TaxID=2762291 RepID=UPI001B845882|nr:flagellar hook-length control protein FliK [Undibacterium rugosum]MBR7778226.1 flagellar hook-length control protein FliK [Undibacterium rugosum]
MPVRLDSLYKPISAVEAISSALPLKAGDQNTYLKFAQLALGQPAQAEVLGTNPDQLTTIRIGDLSTSLKLPASFSGADKLSFRLLTLTPTIHISLQNPAQPLDVAHYTLNLHTDINSQQAQWVRISPEQLSASLALQLAQTDASSVTQLSPLSQILLRLTDKGKILSGAELLAAQPLLNDAQDLSKPALMADTMKKAIAQSGLFYESHIAAWAQGQLEQKALEAEPQHNLLAAIPPEATEQSGYTDSLKQLIQNQLQLLEQDKLQWRGELFPGQPLEWVITRESPHQTTVTTPPTEIWHTHLRMTLPGLGELDAKLQLHQNTVQIAISAVESSALTLAANERSLRTAIEAAGMQISGLQVSEAVATKSDEA